MPFDLKNINPAIRIYWPESEQDEWVEIRVPSREDHKNILQKLNVKLKHEYKSNPDTRRLERIEYLDAPQGREWSFDEELIDVKIVNWNLKTPNGELIPCTKENKVKMMWGCPQFEQWIEKELLTADKAIREVKGEEEKNS